MQDQTAARQVNPSARKGALKTILWLCIFLGLGWLISGPLFNVKPAPETRKTKNDSWLVGENDARVKELGAKYNAINFNDLSDYYYHSPDPWETPDPQLVKKSKNLMLIKMILLKEILILVRH